MIITGGVTNLSESQITKRALADSIKQLMKTIPLEKISIQEIVDHCGLNRQTFYYHFRDKFDLVNWIYFTEAVEVIADCKSYQNWSEGMRRLLAQIACNKQFYVNALRTPGENTFNHYFFEVSSQLIMGVIQDLSCDMDVSNTDRKFIGDFYTHAFVGLTTQWIMTGMKEAPESLVHKIRDIVEGSMLSALTRFVSRSAPPVNPITSKDS